MQDLHPCMYCPSVIFYSWDAPTQNRVLYQNAVVTMSSGSLLDGCIGLLKSDGIQGHRDKQIRKKYQLCPNKLCWIFFTGCRINSGLNYGPYSNLPLFPFMTKQIQAGLFFFYRLWHGFCVAVRNFLDLCYITYMVIHVGVAEPNYSMANRQSLFG